MPRNRFEAINSFFHITTFEEESANPSDPLKKVRKFHNSVKKKCLELYQPLKELSLDERMVRSKARSHFRQYIRNKPTRWGFKFWVMADPTGYTCDFNLYCGRQCSTPISENGLAFDVVTELVQPFYYQGYSVFFDNLYTSPTLLHFLKEKGISCTGTLRTNRRGIPASVVQLKNALNRSGVPRGMGYYIRDNDDVYVCWRDNSCVCVLSNEYPGHSDGVVKRSGRNESGEFQSMELPLPAAIKQYNRFMGGVDMSDQLISYHRVLRQTKKYWKTLFYHLLEICLTNAAILDKWFSMEQGKKPGTMSTFRDNIVLAIIETYGEQSTPQVLLDNFQIRHGSKPIDGTRKICVICHKKCTRHCPDCPFTPSLCQSLKKDCHGRWHSSESSVLRNAWFSQKKHKLNWILLQSRKRGGRPKGSKNKRFRVRH